MTNPALLDAVLARSTGKGSRVHGPAHWAGVAAAGLTLLDSTPDADPLVVLLFALFHDSMRESDGRDPEHGKRGSQLARRMRDAGEFKLDDARLLKLEDACARHDKGRTSMDPTIGVCWDADRLNLVRIGRNPNPALLSTLAGRRITVSAARRLATFAIEWRVIFRNYKAVGDPSTNVHLRFGDLPPEGRSSMRGFGIREPGVSVYPGSRSADGFYTLDFERPLFGLDTRFLAVLLKEARGLFVVEGRQIGVGGMGEPLLADARIVEEVPARNVRVLPNRERFQALIKAWRLKREGLDPGDWAFFAGGLDPEERPVFVRPAGVPSMGSISEMVEARVRAKLLSWGGPGFVEDYDKMQAERESRPKQSFNNAPWKESPWK